MASCQRHRTDITTIVCGTVSESRQSFKSVFLASVFGLAKQQPPKWFIATALGTDLFLFC